MSIAIFVAIQNFYNMIQKVKKIEGTGVSVIHRLVRGKIILEVITPLSKTNTFESSPKGLVNSLKKYNILKRLN